MEMNFKIGVIGLGYVGFPLACLFAKKYPVIGYDINERRIKPINAGIDSTNEVTSEALETALSNGMICTNQLEDLKVCNVYVVAIPTPVDDFYNPDRAIKNHSGIVIFKCIEKKIYSDGCKNGK
jgi:UDP-N-acetyl-D-galactosamine dehydrogenase